MNGSTTRSREKSKYLKTNENENTTTQNLWDTAKAFLRGNFFSHIDCCGPRYLYKINITKFLLSTPAFSKVWQIFFKVLVKICFKVVCLGFWEATLNIIITAYIISLYTLFPPNWCLEQVVEQTLNHTGTKGSREDRWTVTVQAMKLSF